jgi:transcriptional regulator of heat shock response
MTDRKMALLSQIIKEYIKTASPIGSKILAHKGEFDVSSATIRNEMAELEKEGYLIQPHTSAGRIPTARGYEYYLETIKEGRLSMAELSGLKQIFKKHQDEGPEFLIKHLAKKIADLSQNTVVVGFADNDVYYTGIANLFKQPEFQNPENVYNMSVIIDHLDKVMADIFEEINDIEVRVGRENPFGEGISVVLSNWGKRKKGIFGILGPMRMDYEKNLGLVKFVNQNI